MIQVSGKYTYLCGSFNANETDIRFRYMDFLYPFGSFVSENIGCPYSLVGYVSLRYMVSLARKKGSGQLSFYYRLKFQTTMPTNLKLENGRIICTPETTWAHETRISSQKAKWLKPSNTQAVRKSFVSMFLELYPSICRMKVKHTSRLFIVRADAAGRELHAAAYTLRRLAEKFDAECKGKIILQ